MNDFQYRDSELHCEQVPLAEIARKAGTPCYIYSRNTLLRHFRAFDQAFSAVPHLTAFAVKANSNPALLRLFTREGGGADIVSGGELYTALHAGVPADRIVFAGVGKQEDEIRDALRAGILMFNVESPQELHLIHEVAGRMRKVAPVALRVNPDIDPKTHPYVSTGLKKSKFGMRIPEALEQYRRAQGLRHVKVVGVHSHIGSQLTDVRPFVAAVQRIVELVRSVHELGADLRYIDIGGGLGISYEYQGEEPPPPKELAQAVVPLIQPTNCTLVLEPGRVIAGNSGVLLTRVLYTKDTPEKRFVVVDAGMNDLIRPSLYQAYHEILPVVRQPRDERAVDVVGPVCESGDFLALDRKLPEARPGELLAVMSAGAYGFAMASNYNSRPRPAEVLVDGKRWSVIRRRETYRDLLRGTGFPRRRK